tara:strand:- start:138 stop:296 length:159 start_codon:yes stop_codon:yes gene_type:complete
MVFGSKMEPVTSPQIVRSHRLHISVLDVCSEILHEKDQGNTGESVQFAIAVF